MTEVRFICHQCVDDGAVPDRSKGDTSYGINQEVLKLTFVNGTTYFKLACGHTYKKFHHSLGVDVDLVE